MDAPIAYFAWRRSPGLDRVSEVLLGQGLNSGCYDPMADLLPDEQVAEYLRDIVDVISGTADEMPSHADFISRYCAAEPPQ